MKKITTILFLLVSFVSTNAQDTIIKISKDTVLAKILEITPEEIKYKRFDYIDGPTFTELKSAILYVRYSNGVKETFKQESKPVAEKTTVDYYAAQPPVNTKIEVWGNRYRYQSRYLSESDIHDVLINTKDRKIINMVGQAKDAKNMQFIGFAGIPLGIASIGFFWKSTGMFSSTGGNANGKFFNDRDIAISALCGVAAIACPITAITFKANRNKYNRQAVKMYNEKF